MNKERSVLFHKLLRRSIWVAFFSYMLMASGCASLLTNRRGNTSLFRIEAHMGSGDIYYIFWGGSRGNGFIYNSLNTRVGRFRVSRNGIRFFEPVSKFFFIPNCRAELYKVMNQPKYFHRYEWGYIKKNNATEGVIFLPAMQNTIYFRITRLER